jgi:phosphoribosylamine--glycine ligase
LNLLVVGSGGREHALTWKLVQSPLVKSVIVAPGNPGMALETGVECSGVSAADFPGILALCRAKNISLVVVGPDQALADGLVDFLEGEGVPAFGPTRAAARLESSKAFSKQLMSELKIPTARFQVFSDFSAAQDFLESVEWGEGWVVKADGLALGKGVVVCLQREEALLAAGEFLRGGMGEAGRTIVVEERLVGREVSAFSLCDGETGVSLGFACDYKRIFDGDQGPNTGGMGAYSPADWLAPGLEEEVRERVVSPLLKGMTARGCPFKGVLFTGLMITAAGPKVLEFNARFGDPETQALLPLLAEDLLPWLQASRDGKISALSPRGPRKKDSSSVHVVMAAAGYPGTGGAAIRKGDAISLPSSLLPAVSDRRDTGVKVFFAGVSGSGGSLVTSGGRVLGVTALGKTRAEARALAYEQASQVKFTGAQRRSDVGS